MGDGSNVFLMQNMFGVFGDTDSLQSCCLFYSTKHFCAKERRKLSEGIYRSLSLSRENSLMIRVIRKKWDSKKCLYLVHKFLNILIAHNDCVTLA